MPGVPKNVKKGDPVLAKEYNQILQELRRLGRLNDLTGGGNNNNFKRDQIIFGVVVDAGPSAQADYTDARYWIQFSTIEQVETDDTETEVSFAKRPSSGDYLYEIVTATNLAETRLDADDDTVTLFSHRLQVGSPVAMFMFSDDGSPSTRRYFFWQPPANLQRMRVKGEENDYLRCVTWDGTTEGTDTILVAKPYDLQRTPFNGNTVNNKTYAYLDVDRRQVDDSSRTYIETIRENYYTDAEIYAEYRPQGDTGVTTTGGTEVYWIDSNQAARKWMRESFLLEDCQDSTNKMLVAGDLLDYVGRIIRLYSTGETCWKVSLAQCDCDLEEVVAEADFSTCEDCLPACITLTRCSGETGGSATLEVRSSGNIVNASVVEYDGTCYTVTLPEDTCTGSEVEIGPNEWTDYSDCDSCKSTCHTATCCDESDTLKIQARGLLNYDDGTKAIHIEGEVGCWTLGSAETCTTHTLVNYTGFDTCTDCNDDYHCYTYTPCDESAPDDITLYSVGATSFAVDDVVLVTVDSETWCYKIDSVTSGRDSCSIPCTNIAGTSTTYEYYEILSQTPEDCDTCTPCVEAVRCDDDSITDIFRGVFEIGKVYKISGNCWEITGKADCDAGATTDADDSNQFETCLDCQSDGNCYNITPCAGGAAILVEGNLEGITTICRGGTSYTVAGAACTGSEVAVNAFTVITDCNECPEGFTKITVVTAFNDTTCEVTTEDVCVKDLGCTA